jgi:hypothetical protein
MTELKPGMRVRCVKPSLGLRKGSDYWIGDTMIKNGIHLIKINSIWYYSMCFKPIIRVKAGKELAPC